MTQHVPNIGPEERRRRMVFGISALALAAIALTVMLALDLVALWRLLLIPAIFAGVSGVLQARSETCVHLARQGQRNMDTGAESIQDEAERACVQRQARDVRIRTTVITGLATVGLMLIPM